MPGAAHLLRRGQSRRPRTDYGNFLSTANLCRLGTDPALQKSPLHNIFFVLLDRDRRLVDAQNTRRLTGGRADSAGKLRKIVGRVQLANSFLPTASIDQIVPVRNQIADRAPRLAKRNAAIHAASALLAKLLFRKILVDLEPIIDALQNRPARS